MLALLFLLPAVTGQIGVRAVGPPLVNRGELLAATALEGGGALAIYCTQLNWWSVCVGSATLTHLVTTTSGLQEVWNVTIPDLKGQRTKVGLLGMSGGGVVVSSAADVYLVRGKGSTLEKHTLQTGGRLVSGVVRYGERMALPFCSGGRLGVIAFTVSGSFEQEVITFGFGLYTSSATFTSVPLLNGFAMVSSPMFPTGLEVKFVSPTGDLLQKVRGEERSIGGFYAVPSGERLVAYLWDTTELLVAGSAFRSVPLGSKLKGISSICNDMVAVIFSDGTGAIATPHPDGSYTLHATVLGEGMLFGVGDRSFVHHNDTGSQLYVIDVPPPPPPPP
eukprot:Sspe_Gene.32714::Locus_16022_Transcript_1_1_Confidence_1.000_Length_1043::g.32714::m.32714